jgi:uncharacterized damage-inducible protein DinB
LDSPWQRAPRRRPSAAPFDRDDRALARKEGGAIANIEETLQAAPVGGFAEMTHQDLETLLDYQYWARDRMLAAIEPLSHEQYTRDMGSSFRSVRETVVHIYAAEWIWFRRWQGESPTSLLSSEQFPDLPAIRDAWRLLETDVRAHLASLGDAGIERITAYRFMNGQPGATPFWQMLQHVVNHGTYHRGQVTTMLRQLGVAPPKSLDLIAFYREGGTVPKNR